MATRAEEHAQDPGVVDGWRHSAWRAVEGGHPADQPCVFYHHFDDGSMAQVTVSPSGDVAIEAGIQYDDKTAQEASDG